MPKAALEVRDHRLHCRFKSSDFAGVLIAFPDRSMRQLY
jgi:hypothetical protein